MILDAARHALHLHAWLTSPDFDQEGDIQRAEAALATFSRVTPLLAAALGAHAWLDGGGERLPLRAALIRHWRRRRLLRGPVPLTGAAALRPDTSWEVEAWVPVFLTALADEAEDGLQLLAGMERIWFAARRAVAGGRIDSRAGPAIDLMAATPLVSATSLASGLGMAVKNATALLDRFCREGIAIEVTHRSKRRLYGLAGLAPLRDGVAAPRRPEPGRGKGRPPLHRAEPAPLPPAPLAPARPLTPLERRTLDYTDLENAMAFADERIREARRTLAVLLSAPAPVSNAPASDGGSPATVRPLMTAEPTTRS
jgi:hypothetical protein